MNKEFIFNTWAPEGALWSTWVKPVLFACMDTPPYPVEWTAVDVTWAPAAAENAALVLDLPGAIGVEFGLALAEQGYRPVPLYNAVPTPFHTLDSMDLMLPRTAVEVTPIMAALWHGAIQRLQNTALPYDAPPAFLLDWNRRGSGISPGPGDFDNRSVSFTTDFPSAIHLQSHGVRRAIVVQPTGFESKDDIAHTLRRWQDGGVAIELKALDTPQPPLPFVVPKPSWFGWAWQRVLVAAGLRRSGKGGFGGWVPEPGSGG